MLNREVADSSLSAHSKQSPTYLLCEPRYLSTEQPNNQLMIDILKSCPPLSRKIALEQFDRLHRFVSKVATVRLLPPTPGLQDQVYVSNLGIALPDGDSQMIALSKFFSAPRRGEEVVGHRCLSDLGYRTLFVPEYFEGAADLKRLRDGVYVGASGIRTSALALKWIADRFDIKIIECNLRDPYLYHLDCVMFPLSRGMLLAATEAVNPATLREIEAYAEIVDVPIDAAYAGATNCVRLGNTVICDDNRRLFDPSSTMHANECAKLEYLEGVCESRSLKLMPFEMTEFAKSGAAMSCLFMQLDHSYDND